MTSIVTYFKSIRRKLDRQEQKAEFEAKEEAQRASYAGLYGVMVPFARLGPSGVGRLTGGGSCECVTLATAKLPIIPLPIAFKI